MPVAFHHSVFFHVFFRAYVGVDTGMPVRTSSMSMNLNIAWKSTRVKSITTLRSAIRRDVAWPTAMEQHGKYPKNGQFGGSKIMGSLGFGDENWTNL